MSQKKPVELNTITRGSLDVDRMIRDTSERFETLSKEELHSMDKELEEAFPGGFTERDEANALIAMTVRNGPIEQLHAGKYSALLEDPTLSRITNAEMKALMLNATTLLAALLKVKERDPDLYRRWIQSYGRMYCQFWEREQ
jgi:hypothetical protein